MPKKKQKFAQVTDKHQKAMKWCINNNIKVGVKPTKKFEVITDDLPF